MIKKRLDRDLKWFFQGFPYYQMRMDSGDFHGLVSIIELTDGEHYFWNLPKAGKTPVSGKGMRWLQLIPDGKHRVITAMFLPEDGKAGRRRYKKTISLWYVDIIEDHGVDSDGVAYFTDKYLDVIFDIEGDVHIADRDELDEAYLSGELSKKQYDDAIAEGEAIIDELCYDIPETQHRCERILKAAMQRIHDKDRVLMKNVPE